MKKRKLYPVVLVSLLLTLGMTVPALAADTDTSVTAEGTAVYAEAESAAVSSDAEDAAVNSDAETESSAAYDAGDSDDDLTETNAESAVVYDTASGDDGETSDTGEAESYTLTLDNLQFQLHARDNTLSVADLGIDDYVDSDSYTWVWTTPTSSKETVATASAAEDGTLSITAVGDGTAKITGTITGTEIADEGDSATVTVTYTINVTVALYNGLQPDATGATENYYYYSAGVVQTGPDVVKGTVDGETGWWYVNASGMVEEYTGFAKNTNGTWYVESGKVTFNKNSVVKDKDGAIGTKGTWWYVVGSKVQTGFTGLADYSNENGWWYIENGKVTFSKTTVAKNKNGWYYVKNSKVDFTYTGFAQNSNGWWYIEKGKVTFKKNSVIKGTVNGTNAWWYVVGSKVQTGFTGLANYSNSNGWWYIRNGKVDFSVNTVAKNKNGWWYVTGGKVQFGYTGLANYSNANGWWYIKKGKVDFTYTGLAQNKNGWWYVQKGKVNFQYNGNVKWNGITCKVKNGKLAVTADSAMYSKAKNMSSSTKWLILVDTSKCRVGIFYGSKGNWTAMAYWQCTPGKSSTPTVKGSFTVKSKGKSFGTSSYTCWYYTQFYGNYLFHSVLYYPGSMTRVKDGRLGMNLSHGCVRLSMTNAKWIYDNIPIGTKVYVY